MGYSVVIQIWRFLVQKQLNEWSYFRPPVVKMLVIVIFTAETSYGARCLFILLKNFLLKKPD